MLKILKLSFLYYIILVLYGCASIEYYELIEPERSANQQFIGTPYVYSGLVNTQTDSKNYQFSGVLYDLEDKYLDITIASTEQNLIELTNSDTSQLSGEPALLVVNPDYPFHLDTIKGHPQEFFQQNYLKYQPLALAEIGNEKFECPDIILLNIDIYEEFPTTLEFGYCAKEGDYSTYTWHTSLADKIANNVEHDKMLGYQIAYLGFIVTVPVDVIVASLYTLSWGLVSSKNLMVLGKE
jgi:hypothetical protein